ncbi:MAG: hypothetical protein FWD34_05260 [Oscillospiraceae bacterium]|nr:hypothetical protein [Oscillospiraceae bacterium]
MKKQRLQLILDIIREKDIENQDMLTEELQKRGILVTQATVSRDINELKLIKSPTDEGVNRYIVPKQVKNMKFSGIFTQAVKHIDFAMNTVVIKCHPGMAGAVCTALDLMEVGSIVGTIAGDDTIFAVTRSERDAMDLAGKLRRFM